jgi:hypothetical protein
VRGIGGIVEMSLVKGVFRAMGSSRASCRRRGVQTPKGACRVRRYRRRVGCDGHGQAVGDEAGQGVSAGPGGALVRPYTPRTEAFHRDNARCAIAHAIEIQGGQGGAARSVRS